MRNPRFTDYFDPGVRCRFNRACLDILLRIQAMLPPMTDMQSLIRYLQDSQPPALSACFVDFDLYCPPRSVTSIETDTFRDDNGSPFVFTLFGQLGALPDVPLDCASAGYSHLATIRLFCGPTASSGLRVAFQDQCRTYRDAVASDAAKSIPQDQVSRPRYTQIQTLTRKASYSKARSLPVRQASRTRLHLCTSTCRSALAQ